MHCKGRNLFGAAILALTVAAFAMRLYRIDQIPAGLFYDEAYEGLDAYSLFGRPPWAWPLFFTAINGREPLFVYLVHLAQWLWGPTVLAVRAVSAAAGALLIPAMVWLGWEIAPALRPDASPNSRPRFALWAGLAVLALLWSQTIARLAQRMSLFVLLETLLWAGLWRAWRTNRLRWWLLAGLLAGLSFYTYLAVRLLPLVWLLLLGLALLRHRPALHARRQGIGVALLAGLIVAAPLLLHFAANSGHFNMRTGQVNILSQGGLPALLDNVGRVLGMAFVRGDFNVRLNYPDRPVLDALTVVPFLVGLSAVLIRFWRPGPFFLLSGLGIMFLPTLLSEEAPNFGRAIGALPTFVLLVVFGLDRLAGWGERLQPALRPLYSTAGWAILLASTLLTWRAYFVQWAGLPELFAGWDTGYTELARHIRSIPAGDPGQRVYVGPGAGNPSLEYLLLDAPESRQPQEFDGRICLRLAPDLPAHYYFLTTLDQRGENLLRTYLPDGESRLAVAGVDGADWARVVVQPPGGRVVFPEMAPWPVPLEDGIELLGYWLSQPQLLPGQRLYVRLFWRANAVPGHSYTTFVHLLQSDPAGTAQPLAGVDALPGSGACPTDRWLPGEVVVDELQFVLPEDLPAPAYHLAVGFYTLVDLQRLAVPGHEDDQIRIGPLAVEGTQ